MSKRVGRVMNLATTRSCGYFMTGDDVPGQDLQRLFGANFRHARLKAGMSQEDVHKHTGMTRHAISKVENGKVNLTLASMDRLARAVDHGVKSLLDEASETSETNRKK